MAKFKVGDKVRVREDLKIGWSYGAWCFNSNMSTLKGEELTVEKVYDESYRVKENTWYWADKMLEEVKEDKMEKTFREVIADIKPGEVWESENNSCDIRITRTKTGISIRDFNDNAIVWFDDNFKFKLQRKEYTFEEAFKAYEEGKEIESCIEGQRYKKEGGEDYYFDFNKEKYILLEWNKDIFTITSIRNKWYIND